MLNWEEFIIVYLGKNIMCKRLWFVNKIFLSKGMEFVIECNEILISETQTNNSVVLKHKHKF
jgi:hypothetical protein